MSNTPTTNNHQEEIDLGYLVNKVNQLFKKSVKLLFELIGIFIKYKIITAVIFVLAVAYGIYKDQSTSVEYNNQALVIPNFESVDYLYDKVDALNAKVRGQDSLYLKQILGSNHRKLREIEIEPITDIYNFGAKSRENIDILRILFQNQDFNEFVDHVANSKNYKYHRINFKIIGEYDSKDIVNNLLIYLNENEHYLGYQSIFKEHYQFELNEVEKMIGYVDSIFDSAKTIAAQNATGQSVFINDNSQLNNLLFSKRSLIEDRVKLKLKIEDQEEIIKTVKLDLNLLPESGFRVIKTVLYPFFVFFIFSVIFFFRYFYLKLREIAESN
jgi:hypothetical protein